MDPNHLNAILTFASGLLRRTSEADSPLKPTDFYCEGWLTALTLEIVNDSLNGIDLPPFTVGLGGRWWREAGLRSSFPKDRPTWADAALGHFDRRRGTKRGILIRADATQFSVIEAKVDAALSPKTTTAAGFDQAARNVACMATELQIAGVDVSQFTSLQFFVIAPDEYIETHRPLVARDSIERKLRVRIEGYNEPCRSVMERWYAGPFRRLLDVITLKCLTWESVIERAKMLAPVRGLMLEAFYKQCRALARHRDWEEC